MLERTVSVLSDLTLRPGTVVQGTSVLTGCTEPSYVDNAQDRVWVQSPAGYCGE